jgi:hypothetical protein
LTHSPSTDKSTSNYNYNNNAKPLSISIQSSQNIVNGRGASTITATVYDVVTGKKIDNAIVELKITFTSNGTSKEIVRRNGEVTYSAKIKPIRNLMNRDLSKTGRISMQRRDAPSHMERAAD